jgi:hypothetical protein
MNSVQTLKVDFWREDQPAPLKEVYGTVLIFQQQFTLDDASGSHA